MRSGDFGKIERGLDRKRFRNRRMRIFPVGQRPLRLAHLELVARAIDQRAGFAMNAGDRVRTERSDRAKAVQENVIGHRFDDARHPRHVELEGADAVLFGIAGNFLDLLLGENLRMKDRVDIAAFVHRPQNAGR